MQYLVCPMLDYHVGKAQMLQPSHRMVINYLYWGAYREIISQTIKHQGRANVFGVM